MRHDHRVLMVMSLLTVTLAALSCRAPEQASSAPAAAENTPPANPLEGVWRETEIVVTGSTASTIQNPQPSLYIFTPTHYAMMGTLGDRARAPYKTLVPTSEEKIAAFDSFWGNSGTYEVSGNVLTIRPVVARMPNFMGGGFERYRFQVDGNTLSLTFKSTDGHYRVGEEVVPDSRPSSETRKTLVRVQ